MFIVEAVEERYLTSFPFFTAAPSDEYTEPKQN